MQKKVFTIKEKEPGDVEYYFERAEEMIKKGELGYLTINVTLLEMMAFVGWNQRAGRVVTATQNNNKIILTAV